jgi:hypothetical protein
MPAMLLKSHTGNLFVRRVRRWSKYKPKYQQTIFIAQRPNLLPQGVKHRHMAVGASQAPEPALSPSGGSCLMAAS